MRMLIVALMTVVLSLSGLTTSSATPIPDYAKWGIIAVKETQTKYNVDILDYKHIGRTSLTADQSREQFKLWVRNKEGKQFAVYVNVDFNPSTQQLKKVQFTESDRR
ncbi:MULTISPECIES: DUF3889 domain-containing protein [Paenibacillus]|uniref:DUF3889 domain-containing protein n=1 Tax=Paenibacillus TaxID=44249 RepID=UPI0003FDC8E1|nr:MULTISPECIES: DUF3889 domain-containing protein [Paenibacillus]KGP81817.1 hypothetical protein P364_0115815 [Paenibacillus sp. MAEPY2]KGP86640.1 hypothetical protein P363_0116345 [Paenibacillus sp. MAEPY1]OZQ63484.1 hypothetical protein CA599_24250 [Paenibacillus taichungensis]HBU85563.1 DUF3889 domain-containing protein [Paenibacillus sp.]